MLGSSGRANLRLCSVSVPSLLRAAPSLLRFSSVSAPFQFRLCSVLVPSLLRAAPSLLRFSSVSAPCSSVSAPCSSVSLPFQFRLCSVQLRLSSVSVPSLLRFSSVSAPCSSVSPPFQFRLCSVSAPSAPCQLHLRNSIFILLLDTGIRASFRRVSFARTRRWKMQRLCATSVAHRDSTPFDLCCAALSELNR
jgi:hypothetical protein